MINVIKNVRVLKKFETSRMGTSISVGYGINYLKLSKCQL